METGVAIIQEPVLTKTSVEEAPAGVILDHSSMEVDKVNLSTVLDDEITSRDCRDNIISGEADVVNGSGNKETEVVEDSKIVKEKTSETERDEQGTIFVHEPESFNKNTDDSEIVLSDVTSEKEIEEDLTRKPEEVSDEKPIIEEHQTETKHSPEQEEKIGTISKVLIDTAPAKVDEDNIEKSLNSIPIKTDEVKEEKDSRTAETSVNGTEAEHNATVSVEEISRNSENILNETAPEEETATNGESVHNVDVTKRVLLEAENKEEMKTEAESTVNAKEKVEKETVSNEETTSHESESLKGDDHQRETAEPVETIKHSGDAENTDEVQESLTVIKTPIIQGEDDDEHEHVLVRDIPQGETLVTQAETKTDETDAEPSLNLKVDKKQEEAETVKTVISSDEVQESNMVIEPLKTSPELKEEEEQSSKDTEGDEHILGRNVPHGEIFVAEAETLETKEDTEPIMGLKEDKEHEETEKLEEIPSDPALKVDKEELKDENLNADQADGTQTMEEQRGLDSNDPESEKIDLKKTEETPSLPGVESVEQLQKPSLESHSQVSEETSKPVDEQIEEKAEEEVPLHQEDQKEGSNIFETKEEKVLVQENRELGEKFQEERNVDDLTSLQDESCFPNEQKKQTKLQKEETEKHEPTNEEGTNVQQTLLEEEPDEVVQDSSASSSEEREGETVAGAIKIEDIKADEVEQSADRIQKETVETTEPHSSLPSSLEKQEHGTVAEAEKIEVEKVKEAEPMGDISEKGLDIAETTDLSLPLEASNLVSEFEEQKPKQVREFLEGDITPNTEEVQESNKVIERSTIHGEDTESKASLDHKEDIDESSKDTEEHEHVLVRDIPQVETLVTEAETVDTSTVQESEILKNLETKEDTKTSLDLKEDKEQEETETAKTVISSDEVRSSNVQAEDVCERTEPCISEIKDENVRRAEFVEETIQDESSEKHDNLHDEQPGESDKHQEKEPETVVAGDETTHHQSFLDVESDEKMQKPSLESPSTKSEETSKTVDENFEEKPEQVTQHQEVQEEGSYGLETKEETVSVPESSEIGVKSHEEESHVPNEQEKETNFQKEQIQKHEPTNEDDIEESLNSNHEEIQIKSRDEENVPIDETSEVNTEKYSRTAETSANGTEAEHVATVPVEEISRSIVNETAPEDDRQGEKAEPVVAIKNSDDAEKISHEVSGDKEKENEVQENPKVIETLTIQGEDIESKASNDTEQHEHELVRDMPQVETLLTEAESVDASTVQESVFSKTLETKVDETEEVHSAVVEEEEEGQETKEDTEPSLYLKADKEQEEIETVKTDISSEEVRSSDVKAEEFSEHTKPCSSEIKDESHEREESVEVKTSETVQEEGSEKNTNLPDDKTKLDQVDGTQTMEEQRGLDLRDPEAEQSDRSRTNETEELPIVEAEETTHDQALLDVISVEKIEKPSLESPSAVSKETSKNIDEKIEEKPEEEVPLHQESQDEGSNGLETKEETLSVPQSTEIREKSQEEESCPSNEQEEEPKLQKEPHESTSEEDTNAHQIPVEEKSDEVIQVSSASVSEGREGETIVEAEKIEDIKGNEVEQVADRDEKEEVSSTEKGETKKEDENLDEHVDSPEKNDNAILNAKTSENVCIKQKELEILEAPKLEESKEDKSQEIAGTIEAIETKGDHSLAIETAEASSFISELEDKIPKQIEEIHEEEKKEAQDIQVVVDRSLPVETSHEDQTPTLVSEHDDQNSKKVEEIHEEETKVPKLQEEEIIPTEIVPRESFSEAPVSMLASEEDDQVTVQESNCAGDKQEEQDVSAETKESAGETKPKEPEVERTENEVTKVEDDEDTKHTDIEAPQSPENACLKQEDSKELGDETSSTLPVVENLKELQNTLETERAINESASLGENKTIEPTEQLQNTGDADAESSVNDLHSFKEEPETMGKNLVTDMREPVTDEKHDNNVSEESPASEVIEANMPQQDENGDTEKIHEENSLAGKSLPVEELQLQEEHKEEEKVQDGISKEFEVNIEEKLKEKTKEIAECKEETPADHVVTSEKQITEPPSEAEKDSNEEHAASQAITKEIPKDQREEVSADKSLTKEALDEQLEVPSSAERKPSELIQSHQSPNQVEETSFEVKKAQEDKDEETIHAFITSDNVQVQDPSKDFEQEKKSSDLTYVQEDNGTNAKLEVRDDDIRGDGHDSVVSGKEETCLTEEKREVDYVNTEPGDAIKLGVSAEEKNNSCERTDREATKDIYQEKTAIKEEIIDEEKERTKESFNGMKNTDDAIEKTKPEIGEIEKLSSVSDTQDKSSKQEDEVSNQKKDDDVSKLENLKIAEELQQEDGESDKNKEPEPTVKEPARKSLSDLIQKVKGTNKTEDTTKPHIEEEPKTEEEDEDGDEHKDDKTSPDSIVMVEAKDTVSITKTHHKKSQGILSGVGSKVKHSISKVKKALAGKSSHTTKESL